MNAINTDFHFELGRARHAAFGHCPLFQRFTRIALKAGALRCQRDMMVVAFKQLSGKLVFQLLDRTTKGRGADMNFAMTARRRLNAEHETEQVDAKLRGMMLGRAANQLIDKPRTK